MATLLLVFFLSGACALAYQIIWIRLFGLVFGGTVVSMSVVVAVFMGGLALGSHYIGKYARTVGNRVRLYGILEVCLGLFAAVLLYVLRSLPYLVYHLPFATDVHTFTGIGIRILFSCLLLIVPTMIMGASLPVLVRAVTTDKKNIIVNTSKLYAINTLGAMTGAFVVGIFLIRYLGVTRTNFLAAGINIAMGLVAIAVSKRFESSPDTPETDVAVKKKITVEKDAGVRYLVALGLTGFAGLALEMVWLRMLLLLLNNTTYLYTIVITIYLFGLGLGGFALRLLVPEKRRTEYAFGIILAMTGLTVLAGFFFFPETTYTAIFTNYKYYSTFPRMSIMTGVLFTLLGFVPVFLMGLSFPLGLGLYAREVKGLSGRIGFSYAVNTAGSLVGSLAAIFVLIPAIGIKGTVILCSIAFILPSLYFTLRGRKSRANFAVPITVLALSVVFVAVSARIDIPREILARRLQHPEKIEYLKEGPSSTIWISGGTGIRKIWVDNLWVSSTSNEGTHALLAHYPLLFHKNPKEVCGIAFGTGQTFGTCLLYPIDHITSVEIDAEIIKACKGRFTRENYGILENPRNSIVIDDGRFFMTGTQQKFDIVTAEPLQPYTKGTVNLYSLEFYEACRRTLQPGGIVAQWLPVYNSGVEDTWSMVRTFAEAFDHVLLFLNSNDGILLGSQSEMKIDPTTVLSDLALKDLTRVFNGNVYGLTGNFICSREKLLEACGNHPIITDDKPTLEFTAPISHWTEDVTAEVEMRRQFLALQEPISSLFAPGVAVDWEMAELFSKSRTLINNAFLEDRSGNTEKAHKLYEEALRINPADDRAKMQLYVFLRKYSRLNLLAPDLKQYFTRPDDVEPSPTN